MMMVPFFKEKSEISACFNMFNMNSYNLYTFPQVIMGREKMQTQQKIFDPICNITNADLISDINLCIGIVPYSRTCTIYFLCIDRIISI